jgi:hypothetical protein
MTCQIKLNTRQRVELDRRPVRQLNGSLFADSRGVSAGVLPTAPKSNYQGSEQDERGGAKHHRTRPPLPLQPRSCWDLRIGRIETSRRYCDDIGLCPSASDQGSNVDLALEIRCRQLRPHAGNLEIRLDVFRRAPQPFNETHARPAAHIAGTEFDKPSRCLGHNGRMELPAGQIGLAARSFELHNVVELAVARRLRQCSTARARYFLAVSRDTPN